MTEKCEHKTSAILADEGTAMISSCTWGCGEILVTVMNDDASQVMTVKEVAQLRDYTVWLEARKDKLEKIILEMQGHNELLRDEVSE